MIVHYHWQGEAYTVNGKFLFGFKLGDSCQHCQLHVNEFFELEGAYLCEECHSEVMRALNKGLNQAGPFYD